MKRVVLSALLVVGLLGMAGPATAGESVAADVTYAMEQVPGGILVDANTVVWPELDMTLEVSAARAVGTCATGSICAFSGATLTGTKLSWTACGTQSTAALSTVASIANARTSGTLTAREGTTVRATAAAGGSATVPLAYRTLITSVYC